MNLRNTIVFGAALYLKDGVIKAKENKQKSWEKQIYVAMINGLHTEHGLNRRFVDKKVIVPASGKPILTWEIPVDFKGVIEIGWAYGELDDHYPSTFYVICLGENKYLEITEQQAYREQKMALTLSQQKQKVG